MDWPYTPPSGYGREDLYVDRHGVVRHQGRLLQILPSYVVTLFRVMAGVREW